ncbi:DUF1707 domain-containing protein [Actinoallomurus sp. NBC_01490]|jgi:hypothetical protein|uniref:DUF1707 SHOCT-like domain-containing protein n=1 Tax=Actinoallomurus sp. NBC_01490 TaxID=2903557 RepID=UPI002E33CD5C|nr:DUF1707 domain-containing protein [Actinoallomurus sp. NBC_01490]
MSAEQLRVGDAERDEVTTALHEHFAQGRLTREELDERLTAALSARTVGDLREITRDLPGALAATERPAGPRGRGPWEMGTAHWGRGPFMAPWPRGGGGPHGRGHLARTSDDEEDVPWAVGAGLPMSRRGPARARREWAAYGGWGPAWSGWGPPRGRPFGPLLLVALIVAAVTGGWWVLFPLLACLWLAVAVRGIRHARRHLTARR